MWEDGEDNYVAWGCFRVLVTLGSLLFGVILFFSAMSMFREGNQAAGALTVTGLLMLGNSAAYLWSIHSWATAMPWSTKIGLSRYPTIPAPYFIAFLFLVFAVCCFASGCYLLLGGRISDT